MPEPFKLVRVPSLKTPVQFRAHLDALGLDLPCDDAIDDPSVSPLAQPVPGVRINGRTIGNRLAIHPMEGWDATTSGGVTDDVRRRWQRFGSSGAKLIYGGEAMAVRHDGRANPHQLILSESNKAGLAELREIVVRSHRERFGQAEDLVVGFQLTHSGRFCKPNDAHRLEPRVAFRHPLLDSKFGVTSDSQVFTDSEIDQLILDYIRAARIAWEAGADFVDVKHCHGYLLHEFLGARGRPGKFGGSFENRTRILREIVAGIRADNNPIALGVRLSAFDFVPFRPDPALSTPGRPGPGIPEDFSMCIPYQCAFGCNADHPLEADLTEPRRFVGLCSSLGIQLLNISAGSPYYNPHIQRPAAYPPSDGYQPAHDPLIDVARQIHAVRQLKAMEMPTPPATPASGSGAGPLEDAAMTRAPIFIGSAYSYLQEYLPRVAQAVVRRGWADMVGIGRMTLSYSDLPADTLEKGELTTRMICRTFSDCTTAPRHGMKSGCYPLDNYYATQPEAQKLKAIKRQGGA
ncbi:MAG: dehydrogenase [Verrucomicrobiota bacterium]|jgi:2,4-dienoyl-CoA reductase-like NADH-dependent reductase (Old Yellow Enzyme family)